MANIQRIWGLATHSSPSPISNPSYASRGSLFATNAVEDSFTTSYEKSRANVANDPITFERNLNFLMNAIGL
jgi:hypothetical protein